MTTRTATQQARHGRRPSDGALFSARRLGALLLLLATAGCQTAAIAPAKARAPQATISSANADAVVNRLSWGLSDSTRQSVATQGLSAWVHQQLHPPATRLPPQVQARIDAFTINREPLQTLVVNMERQRKNFTAMANEEERKSTREQYQRTLNLLSQEAASQSILRALHSPNQLQEQLTWFWFNHFNVHQNKHNLRVLVGDYETTAIRPHVLGKFRELLSATVHHPAMLLYLDNDRNGANRPNENYARELMELHTLGVDGGYQQRDVQELARILTGVGVNLGDERPNVRRERQSDYVRRGLFEFNPNRHDYGEKIFLGEPIRARGLNEVEEAIQRLSRHPSTARFISRKLAIFFGVEQPSGALLSQMAQRFKSSDGEIAATLEPLFSSAEFSQSLAGGFKDPVHYVLSALRLAYDEQPDPRIVNAMPIVNWLQRVGQPLYGRQTPDGYPLAASAWNGSGQMTTRFDISRQIASGNAALWDGDDSTGGNAQRRARVPSLASRNAVQAMLPTLSASTRAALAQARTAQEWNTYFLSSPEMMRR